MIKCNTCGFGRLALESHDIFSCKNSGDHMWNMKNISSHVNNTTCFPGVSRVISWVLAWE